MNNIKLIVDLKNLDTVVKLDCGQIKCSNNLASTGKGEGFYCNLKYVFIDHEGKCSSFNEFKETKS